MSKTSAKKQFIAGLRAGIPVILGFVPVGIAFAIMARQAGFSVWETCGMSLFVFAGASQMMAVGMLTSGAGLLALILATFILNLRHVIMGTCIMNRMRGGNPLTRALVSYGVTDEGFAIFTTEKAENCTIHFFFGLFITTYLSWQAGTFIGAVASGLLPDILSASLGVALYAMFIGLLTPNLTGNWKLGALVALTAVCNSILSQLMASSWAMILSTLVCAFIGVFFVDLDDGGKEAQRDGEN